MSVPAVDHDGLGLAIGLVLPHALQEVEEGDGSVGNAKVRP